MNQDQSEQSEQGSEKEEGQRMQVTEETLREYWDQGIITDMGTGIGEYSDTDTEWIAADWNQIPTEIADLLEDQGYELLWLDEWARCSECHRAYRTEPDSYFWESSLVILQEDWCDYVCVDCLEFSWIEEDYVNNPARALTSVLFDRMRDEILGSGFVEMTPMRTRLDWKGNRRTEIEPYESGWHPGQTDDPKEIHETLSAEHDETLFVISEVSQFYLRFRVFVRDWEQSEGKGSEE